MAMDNIELKEYLRQRVGILELYNPKGAKASTAFNIGECHILTSSHHLDSHDKSKKAEIWYSLGITKNEQRPAEARTRARFIEGGISTNSYYTSDDWAVFKLEDCLGRDYGYLNLLTKEELMESDIGPSFSIASVIARGGYFYRYKPTCYLVKKVSRQINMARISCSGTYGESGSPIIYLGPDGRVWAAGILATVDGFFRILPESLNLKKYQGQ